MKMKESYPDGWKTLREKEKLLVTCFQKTCTADTYKPGFVQQMVNEQYSEKNELPMHVVRVNIHINESSL